MTQRFDMAYNNNGDRDIMGMRADLIFMFYERLTISLFQTSNPIFYTIDFHFNPENNNLITVGF